MLCDFITGRTTAQYRFWQSFLTMALLGTLSAIGLYFEFGPSNQTTRWDALVWSVIYLLQIIWLPFTFGYTGLRNVFPRERLVLHGIIAITPVVWIFTNRNLIVALFLVPWLLIMVGSLTGGLFLVMRSALTFKQMPIGQAISIGIAAVAPFFFPAFLQVPSTTTFGLSMEQAVTIGLFVGMAGLLVALGNYRMFDSIPGVGYSGRDQVNEHMQESVIVIDQNRRITDLNPVIDGRSISSWRSCWDSQ